MQLSNGEQKVLNKLAGFGGAGTVFETALWKFENLEKLGLITVSKLYCGPLKLFTGEYELSLTQQGRKANEGAA